MDYYRISEKRVLNNADYYLNGQTPHTFKSYNHERLKICSKTTTTTTTTNTEFSLKLY